MPAAERPEPVSVRQPELLDERLIARIGTERFEPRVDAQIDDRRVPLLRGRGRAVASAPSRSPSAVCASARWYDDTYRSRARCSSCVRMPPARARVTGRGESVREPRQRNRIEPAVCERSRARRPPRRAIRLHERGGQQPPGGHETARPCPACDGTARSPQRSRGPRSGPTRRSC